MNLQEKMFEELKTKEIFEQARSYAFEYAGQIEKMRVFPTQENLDQLKNFEEKMPEHPTAANAVLEQLHRLGSPGTIAQTGGRYFGFVNGGAVPVAIATKWLSDFWDQCGGLYVASPINAKLESVCETWLKEIFNLPKQTVAGFTSGTSMANFCALTAARYRLLKNLGWDINEEGFYGAPKLKIIAHKEVHASIVKTLVLLGFARKNVTWIDVDGQGRMLVDQLPELDNGTLVLLQAGNVNSGSYDYFDAICDKANEAGAWVHIDGAFGLWAAASKSLCHLTKGMEKASSWAVDGHKTLNTPYDSGIVLCKDPDALITALQTHGEYLIYTEKREPILYTTEMSKRGRAIELWATLKYLGKSGVDAMVTGFHEKAKLLAEQLKASGYHIRNKVVFNQVVVACDTEAETKQILEYVQQSGECWCGGSTWNGESVIRVSVCSWATTDEDIERTARVFVAARKIVGKMET